MKKCFFLILLAAFTLANAAAQQAAAEVSFSFTRQSGFASNQYAIWIEDALGNYVRTLYATRWTANGGWRRRPTSIPVWVSRSALSEKTSAEIDAVSGPTPATGRLTYTWDGTNSQGLIMPPGDYVLFLEGTLRWENQVLYRAPIRIGYGAAEAQVYFQFTGNSMAERMMIAGVTVRALR